MINLVNVALDALGTLALGGLGVAGLILGSPRSFHKKFNFSVEIDGITVAWFMSAGPLEAELGVIEQREGGNPVVANQSPGLYKTTPCVLKVGASDNDELWRWWESVIDAESGTGDVEDAFKRNMAIVQKDRNGAELRRWNMSEAWPSKFVAGDWDATSEENVIQEMTVVFKRFKPAI